MNPFVRTRRHLVCRTASLRLAAHAALAKRHLYPPHPGRTAAAWRGGSAAALLALSAWLPAAAAAAAPEDSSRRTIEEAVIFHDGAGEHEEHAGHHSTDSQNSQDDPDEPEEHLGHQGHRGHQGHHDHAGHGPIGLMGDHAHKAGEVMVSYRYMRMEMEGNRDGDDHASVGDLFAQGYLVAPTSMSMDMHMVGAMVGVTDRITAMLMIPWLDVEMEHRTKAGGKFRTKSSGIGDVSLSTIVAVWEDQTHSVLLSAGLGFPTGSINERDDTPMGNQRLPYPMQLGSGTWDLLPGLTYSGLHDSLSWGLQFGATVRTGHNSNRYRLGNRYRTTGWAGWWATPWLNTSLRLTSEVWENIDGSDRLLNPAVVPTADPNRRGGNRLDLGLGLSLLGQSGLTAGHRLGLEVTRPVYQHLDGPQLETDWMITVGWEKAWY